MYLLTPFYQFNESIYLSFTVDTVVKELAAPQ